MQVMIMIEGNSLEERAAARGSLEAKVIQTAVIAINAAESATFDAILPVSFFMLLQRKLSVWAPDAGEAIKTKDIGEQILAGMVLSGRAIEKNAVAPQITDAADALAYVKRLDARDIRSKPRQFISMARGLAAKVLKVHGQSVTGCLQRDSEEAAATAFGELVRTHIAKNLAELERALMKEGTAKAPVVKTLTDLLTDRLDKEPRSADEVAAAIAYLNGVYADLTRVVQVEELAEAA